MVAVAFTVRVSTKNLAESLGRRVWSVEEPNKRNDSGDDGFHKICD